MPLDSHTRDVALDILDRALHPGTSDEEVVASIHAWRRKTGNALIRDVVQPIDRILSGEEPAGAADIVWRAIQRRDGEIGVLRTRLAAYHEEIESFRRKVAVEIDRTVRTLQELALAKAKIADLEATMTRRRHWWKKR